MNYELNEDELIFSTRTNGPVNFIGPIELSPTGIFYPTSTSPTQYINASPDVSMTNLYGTNLTVKGMIIGSSINQYSSFVPAGIFKNIGSAAQSVTSTPVYPDTYTLLRATGTQMVTVFNDTSPLIGSNYTYNTGYVTVKTGGLYEISCEITYANANAGLRDCILVVSRAIEYTYLGVYTTTVATTRGYMIPVMLDPGDVISLWAWQNSGSTLNVTSATLSIYKVGEV